MKSSRPPHPWLHALQSSACIAQAGQRVQGRCGPVAAIVNFGHGGAGIDAAVRDTLHMVQAGAQEVEVVLPYKWLNAMADRVSSAKNGMDFKASGCIRTADNAIVYEAFSQGCRAALRWTPCWAAPSWAVPCSAA